MDYENERLRMLVKLVAPLSAMKRELWQDSALKKGGKRPYGNCSSLSTTRDRVTTRGQGWGGVESRGYLVRFWGHKDFFNKERVFLLQWIIRSLESVAHGGQMKLEIK